MNENITKIKLRAKRICKKLNGCLSRKFDVNLSLKRKNEPENPVIAVNVKGEIPKEIVAFLAVVGLFTTVYAIWKIIKKFC